MRTYAPASAIDVLERLLDEPSLARGVVHHEVRPAIEARYGEWPAWLDPRLRAGLAKRGIERPYIHQADAIEAVHAGEDVVVVTPTASGKSLCYMAPVLQSLAEDPSARALFLFPTKALGQDQVAELSELVRDAGLEVSSAAYDGDTPAPIRSAIRKAGQVVVTNPDMLHSAILPHHTKWFQLFEQLRVIVIDELHMYRGVFGSHVANVLRRLLRLCAHYGSHPVIVCCSATIGNPSELAEMLVGRPVRTIDRNGAPVGREAPAAGRSAGHRRVDRGAGLGADAGRAVGAAVPPRRAARPWSSGGPACPSRSCSRTCARRCGWTSARARDSAATGPATCRPSGARSSAGSATARSSGSSAPTPSSWAWTSGALDVAVLAGYPGSIAATWQQMGRAGRRGDVSIAILVASPAPVDQYVIHHPEFLLGSEPEEARLDPDNLHVLLAHLRAAAFELPFEPGDAFGPEPADGLLAFLGEGGQVRQADDGRWYWSSENFPASEISLRSAAPENVVIIDTSPDRPRVLGEVDLFAAQVLVHEHAIYMHESIQYHVDRLEWGERKAYVHRIDADHYTYANRAVTLKPLDVFASAPATGGSRVHGEVMVASLVTLYKKLKFITDENVGWGPVDLPEIELQTTAYWLTAEGAAAGWRRDELDVALIGAGTGDPGRGVGPADGRPAGPRAGVAGALAAPRGADDLPVRGDAGRRRAVGAAVRPPRGAGRRRVRT